MFRVAWCDPRNDHCCLTYDLYVTIYPVIKQQVIINYNNQQWLDWELSKRCLASRNVTYASLHKQTRKLIIYLIEHGRYSTVPSVNQFTDERFQFEKHQWKLLNDCRVHLHNDWRLVLLLQSTNIIFRCLKNTYFGLDWMHGDWTSFISNFQQIWSWFYFLHYKNLNLRNNS